MILLLLKETIATGENGKVRIPYMSYEGFHQGILKITFFSERRLFLKKERRKEKKKIHSSAN